MVYFFGSHQGLIQSGSSIDILDSLLYIYKPNRMLTERISPQKINIKKKQPQSYEKKASGEMIFIKWNTHISNDIFQQTFIIKFYTTTIIAFLSILK